MKSETILAALLALAVLTASGAAAHDVPSAPAVQANYALHGPAREAARVVDAFHAALARGDLAAAAALLDDGAVIYEEGEAEQSKAAYVASHLPADIGFLAAVHETATARTGGANAQMAWIATQGHVEGRFHDRPVNRETTESMILRKTAVGWRIVHVHWSSRAAAAPGA